MPSAFPARRTAIITGVGSERGIGRRTAWVLAQAGWNLGLIARHADQAERLAAEISAAHAVRAVGAGADLANRAEASRAIDTIEASAPQIVALVNCAGVSSPTPYLEVEPEEWRHVLTANLDAVHWVTQRVARTLTDNGVGRIVSLSSVSSHRGGGTYSKTPYSASKAAVEALMRGIARELGRRGVTANAIAPGPVDTDLMGGTLTPERKEGMAADSVLDAIATPQDVAATIRHLVSEEAALITGQTVHINGGLHMT
ncbi:SDR family NAD(P)-dependent oxidoreductase [Brevibacterium yomogidense]|uniref:SDR family NAD(P)-dependent oxidoreductase n=1 Tax=Brevibacterium yomogidense TaxID=946573 RepID=UPI0018E0356F|nr:SDR family oxidoreductase [Brevibacterium yomogidense]